MKKYFIILGLLSLLLFAVSVSAQRITTLGGMPAKLIAEFNDNRACRYYLVQDPDLCDTGLEDTWVLVKTPLRATSMKPIVNPYDIDGSEYGTIRDAKLVGDNLYVINTSYRMGDNLACLNTRTGRWSNPVPQCAQCQFVGENKAFVTYSQQTRSGASHADDRYKFTEKTVILR